MAKQLEDKVRLLSVTYIDEFYNSFHSSDFFIVADEFYFIGM